MKIISILKNFWLRKFNTLKVEIISDGFTPDKERESDYVLGASPIKKSIINESAQWINTKITYENQNINGLETMGCTGYSFNNVLEILSQYQWGEGANHSDRYVNKVTGVTRNGNSMNKVADFIRSLYGLVPESFYAWPDKKFTWEEYYKEIPGDIINLGKDWLKRYSINYESVYTNAKMMKEALKYSPLWVAGFAWALGRDGYYHSWGRANHAFTVIGYKEGEYWIALDSYAPHVKYLAWDFNFSACKILILRKKDTEINWDELKKIKQKGIDYILLLEPCETYDDGAYKIDIDNQKLISVSLKEAADDWVVLQARNGKLQTRTKDTFYKLLK